MINEFSYLKQVPAAIAAGANLTPALKLEGFGVVRIALPASWDTANLTFQVSDEENGTFTDLYDSDGNEVVVIASANRNIVLPARIFGTGFFFIKVRSGTSATAVNQSVARTLKMIVRPL
jgi:hypothetical protein